MAKKVLQAYKLASNGGKPMTTVVLSEVKNFFLVKEEQQTALTSRLALVRVYLNTEVCSPKVPLALTNGLACSNLNGPY